MVGRLVNTCAPMPVARSICAGHLLNSKRLLPAATEIAAPLRQLLVDLGLLESSADLATGVSLSGGTRASLQVIKAGALSVTKACKRPLLYAGRTRRTGVQQCSRIGRNPCSHAASRDGGGVHDRRTRGSLRVHVPTPPIRGTSPGLDPYSTRTLTRTGHSVKHASQRKSARQAAVRAGRRAHFMAWVDHAGQAPRWAFCQHTVSVCQESPFAVLTA